MRRPRILLILPLLVGIGATAGILIFFVAYSDGSAAEGIVFSTKKSNSPRIKNGWAYDKATLDLHDCTALVAPVGALVKTERSLGCIEIYMEKSYFNYAWASAQGQEESPRTARSRVGCACRIDSEKLVIATYGEWAHKEGSLKMNLLLKVPEGMKIEHGPNLSGEKSAALGELGSAREDWTVIPFQPDPKLTARSYRGE